MYIVCWEVIATGYRGHGSPLSREDAIAWVERMNAEHPHDMRHWLEPAAS